MTLDIITYSLAIAAIIIGRLFSLTGVLGYIRLPDVYSRLHATGEVGVFGGLLLAVASALVEPPSFGRAFLLIVMLLLIGPSLSHALAEAAVRSKIKPSKVTRNREALQLPVNQQE